MMLYRDEDGKVQEVTDGPGEVEALVVDAGGEVVECDPGEDVNVYIPLRDENGDYVIYGENGPRTIKLAPELV